MFTADQIICHLIGDYLLQSDWMATEKTKRSLAAAVHAFVYGLVFLVFAPSAIAWLAIVVTHFFIDRFRLARYVVWAKNWMGNTDQWAHLTITDESKWVKRGTITLDALGEVLIDWRRMPWEACKATGYPPDRPAWLTVWLLIIADNIIHLVINGLALRFL